MKLSVVIPVFNGAATIGRLVDDVRRELAARYELEIVLVNDGSPGDRSADVCRQIAESDPRVKFLDLSRNFGEHNAVMAGLNYCTGAAAVIIDDDFQNPPAEIVKLVEALREGYDVVFSSYDTKEHPFLRNLGSRFTNLVASFLIRKPMQLYLSSFKAINRFIIDELVKYRGPYPYIDGLILRISRNYATVRVEHRARAQGRSGYTVRKLVSLWLNMFTSFSVLPLRVATLLGLLIAFAGLCAAVGAIIEKLRHPWIQAGWASLMTALLIVSGVQLFAIGMVGEYLGRLFLKDEGNPQFVVRRTINCGEDAHEKP
jgi:undecaprenyl-phosphate 4-deoxy-4-formamido-L-arabinose transferase